jgi:uncharacterized damage-inducible protein DinB
MTEQKARIRRAFWVDPEHDPRDTDELPVDEKTTLRQYLDRYRMTFEMKCEGLTPEQLAARSVPPSTMSLLGLVRHLAKIEHHWFRRTLEGQTDLPHLYENEQDPDLDFDGAVGTDVCVADAWESWRREVAHAREVYARYDDLGENFVPGEPWRVRGVVVHMIEEYARHCGHADLLRECIDGRTGQ